MSMGVVLVAYESLCLLTQPCTIQGASILNIEIGIICIASKILNLKYKNKAKQKNIKNIKKTDDHSHFGVKTNAVEL